MDFKIRVLLIISAQICATLTDQSCACTREYRPLCGSDGNTYKNPCLLRCAISTSGKEIKVIKPVPCNEPELEIDNCRCSHDYSPVCGSDGQTYLNECDFNCSRLRLNQDLQVKHFGPCETPQEADCFCILLFKPVCGSDGKTYSNNCFLNCATKINPSLRLAYKGPCADRPHGIK